MGDIPILWLVGCLGFEPRLAVSHTEVSNSDLNHMVISILLHFVKPEIAERILKCPFCYQYNNWHARKAVRKKNISNKGRLACVQPPVTITRKGF
jgi:hypothetical protein